MTGGRVLILPGSGSYATSDIKPVVDVVFEANPALCQKGPGVVVGEGKYGFQHCGRPGRADDARKRQERFALVHNEGSRRPPFTAGMSGGSVRLEVLSDGPEGLRLIGKRAWRLSGHYSNFLIFGRD